MSAGGAVRKLVWIGSVCAASLHARLFPDQFYHWGTPPPLTAVRDFRQAGPYTVALTGEGEVVAWKTVQTGPPVLTRVHRGLREVRSLAVASDRVYGLREDGTLFEFFTHAKERDQPGPDNYGEIKDIGEQPPDLLAPAGLTDAVAVAAASIRAAALRSDGTVVTWGGMGAGESGPPAGLSGVVQLVAGGGHLLALRKDGTAVAWGRNDAGQASVPAGLRDIQALAAGSGHSLALRRDGTVAAWGRNDAGQASVPAGLRGARSILAGADYSMALLSDGTLAAWGAGFAKPRRPAPGSFWSGPQGGPGPMRAPPPQPPGAGVTPAFPFGIMGFASAAAGPDALLLTGKDGGRTAWRVAGGEVRLLVSALPFRAAAVGTLHAVGLRMDGRAEQWGFHPRLPEPFHDSLRFTAVAAGEGFSLLLRTDGAVLSLGAAGGGAGIPMPATLGRVKAIAASQGHALALRQDGTVAAWGDTAQARCAVPGGLSGVKSVAAGGRHSLALREDGTVAAWGDDGHGQATVPAGLRDVIGIAAGSSHSLALRRDGKVVAWGSSSAGQVSVPEGLGAVRSIVAAENFSVALPKDGPARVWGDDSRFAESVVDRIPGMREMAAGPLFSVGILEDGTLVGTEFRYAWDGQVMDPGKLAEGQAAFPDIAPPADIGGLLFFADEGGQIRVWDPDWNGEHQDKEKLFRTWLESPGQASILDSLSLFTRKGVRRLAGRKRVMGAHCGSAEPGAPDSAFGIVYDTAPDPDSRGFFAASAPGKGPFLPARAERGVASGSPRVPGLVGTTYASYAYPGSPRVRLVLVEGKRILARLEDDDGGLPEEGLQAWRGLFLVTPGGMRWLGPEAPEGFQDVNGDGFLDVILYGRALIRSSEGFEEWTAPEGPEDCC